MIKTKSNRNTFNMIHEYKKINSSTQLEKILTLSVISMAGVIIALLLIIGDMITRSN